MLDFTSYCCQFTPIPVLKTTDAVLFSVGNTQLYENINFTPSGKQPRCWRVICWWRGVLHLATIFRSAAMHCRTAPGSGHRNPPSQSSGAPAWRSGHCESMRLLLFPLTGWPWRDEGGTKALRGDAWLDLLDKLHGCSGGHAFFQRNAGEYKFTGLGQLPEQGHGRR